jgi:hypothetical protein
VLLIGIGFGLLSFSRRFFPSPRGVDSAVGGLESLDGGLKPLVGSFGALEELLRACSGGLRAMPCSDRLLPEYLRRLRQEPLMASLP